ncbi:hypothetical protein H6P81_021486 [Aristolochia fimbriata]|uniref:Small ribosomal subunit protein uS13m n=1 Tax=Aristolochia fimbriata TaxID=158543 RepID=A0AAV7DRH0_ARIFI|nr:hypothetical protein H6P81_021486 [Aristolochia fimbriata]
MSYISGARSVPDEQVRIASTKMDGIGPKKAIQVRYRLGISGNIKMNELTKYQIDQIEQMIGQDHVVHWELKRGERADIERLISISRYRGIRHQDGSPRAKALRSLAFALACWVTDRPLEYSGIYTRARNVEHTTMPPVFISWKSPAEERAVGDGAFCFFSYLERGAEIVPMGSCVAAGIDEKRRAA